MVRSRTIIGIAALCALLGAASALAAENNDESRPGDAAAGRVLASKTCIACHGEDGNSLIAGYPHIAGQSARYLFRQMQLMRDGDRDPKLMAGQLDNMTDQDLRDMAAFYASQAGKIGQASREGIELGEAIYRGGILAKQVAACTACHAPDGSGNALAGFPSLSWQTAAYVEDQLKAYREGQRRTDAGDYEGMMRQTAANMTDGEIAAVANYVLGLH
ncbi:MAG: c-type cytochrome [Gammaproteobacteria bacterium]|nr:c-type cytochrome [Gammaproteobacteria bacterium]